MEQVWFCGVHTDVGGGYKEHGLSDITLAWMIQKAVSHKLIIYPKHKVKIEQDVKGKMHDSRKGIGKLYRKKVRFWNPETYGKPVIHKSVLERTLNKDGTESPEYAPWILELDYETEPWDRSL
jgi:hypothetical protein